MMQILIKIIKLQKVLGVRAVVVEGFVVVSTSSTSMGSISI